MSAPPSPPSSAEYPSPYPAVFKDVELRRAMTSSSRFAFFLRSFCCVCSSSLLRQLLPGLLLPLILAKARIARALSRIMRSSAVLRCRCKGSAVALTHAYFLFMMLLISWVPTNAASSPSQIGSSQQLFNCKPCSEAYLVDSYLSRLTGELVQDSDLAEVSGSTVLCERLSDDIELPVLSELHRHLGGDGSHRRLVSSLTFDNCANAMVHFLDGYHIEVVIIEKLTNSVFADTFELQHLVERKVFLNASVFGDTNLELPAALSNRSTVEIHVDFMPNTSKNCNFEIELPLHARYPPLDASGYARVEIGSPDLFLRYRRKQMSSGSCFLVLQKLDTVLTGTATWHIPCGVEAHTGFVSSITFLSALVCSISIVLGALFF